MSNLFKILTWPFYLYGKFHASRYGNLLTHLGNLCYAAFLRGQLSKSDNLLSFGRNIRFVGTKYISLGKNVSLCDSCRIEAVHGCWWGALNQHFTPQITIGDNVVIAPHCHIACIDKVEIGEYTTMGSFCLLTDHTHGNTSLEHLSLPPRHRPLTSKGPIKIGSHVHMGDRVVVLPGVTIGDHAIIGANAVVTHDVPPYSIVVGPSAHSLHKV